MGHGQGNEQFHAPTGEEEADHEHETEYAHDDNAVAAAAAYSANRAASYSYNAGSGVGTLPSEHAHLSPEINGSPNHHNTSGRGTPRTTPSSQHQWGSDYHTPPRAQPPSSNLYNVMSHEQYGKTATGNAGGDGGYPSQLGLTGALQTAYPSQAQSQQQHPIMNGTSSNKRVREMDDEGGRGSRPASRGPGSGETDLEGLKRRKTLREDSLPMVGGGIGTNGIDPDPGRALNRTRSTVIQRRR